MTQGWTVTGENITFLNPPPAGTNNITVTQLAAGGVGGTDAWSLGAWSANFGYPSEIEFFGDRLWLAASRSDPQTIWGSMTGDYANFGKSTPIVDSDAVTFTINSRQVNAVQDLIPLDKMLVLTKGAEFLMTGGADQVVTPGSVSIRPQSYRGSGGVQAKVVGDTALFVQEQGQHVFDIGYKFESDGYRPTDLSVWADHLCEGHTFSRMEWMSAPWSCLWLMRDDGVKVGLTYMPEQEIIGWHRHETQGEFIDVVCLPDEVQTQTYALVSRNINGEQRLMIEQMADVFQTDIRDWHYVDAGLTYDGRNYGAETLTLSGGVEWLETEDLTVTRSNGSFVSTDIGDGFRLNGRSFELNPQTGLHEWVDVKVRLDITAVNGNKATVNSVGTVPVALRNVAITDWVFLRDSIAGLEHLEGATVAILTDGSVHSERVVQDGKVSLDYPSGVVHVGLPYSAEIRTLSINAAGSVMRDQKKLIFKVGAMVKGTRGLKFGSHPDYMDEFKEREFENWDEPTNPTTGYQEVPISAQWGVNEGEFSIVSDVPLPAEILAVVPKFVSSDAP